jgi:hypothetical protein
VAAGTYTVERVITTAATGTVDCALEAQRCIVAMGAINDYDRSGGFALTFAGGGEPIDIPELTVTPADGLSDGEQVHVEGDGFAAHAPVNMAICSIDPAGCWDTGEAIELSGDDIVEAGLVDQYGDGGYSFTGLVADGDGHVSGDVPVWRFLPATSPGTYIDCAVSDCALRLSADAGFSPPPAHLSFEPGGEGPTPPAVEVRPTDDLEPGQEIVVRGAGFEPGAYYSISLCAAPPDDPTNVYTCFGGDRQEQIEGDGGFAVLFEVPDPLAFGSLTVTTACSTEGACHEAGFPAEGCDGLAVQCTLRVEAYSNEVSAGPPLFQPDPVVVSFRR